VLRAQGRFDEAEPLPSAIVLSPRLTVHAVDRHAPAQNRPAAETIGGIALSAIGSTDGPDFILGQQILKGRGGRARVEAAAELKQES
jgi:hypothetical protein